MTVGSEMLICTFLSSTRSLGSSSSLWGCCSQFCVEGCGSNFIDAMKLMKMMPFAFRYCHGCLEQHAELPEESSQNVQVSWECHRVEVKLGFSLCNQLPLQPDSPRKHSLYNLAAHRPLPAPAMALTLFHCFPSSTSPSSQFQWHSSLDTKVYKSSQKFSLSHSVQCESRGFGNGLGKSSFWACWFLNVFSKYFWLMIIFSPSVKSGQIRNLESARVSMVGQVKQ